MTKKILSIQSKLVYGYVGSNIAELAIQLHGLDVIAFPTVYLSAHTGHQPIHGTVISKELFDDLILGVDALEMNQSIRCVISGYIGSWDILKSAAQYIYRLKQSYPNITYICDPVMGDDGGLYVDEEIAESYLTDIIPICDILTPNHFEFEYIIGHQARTEQDISNAVLENTILCNKTIIITSCELDITAKDEIDTLIIKNGICKRISTKRINISTTGTGDLFTAILSSGLASGKDLFNVVEDATTTIKKALKYTVDHGNDEMNAACLLKSIKH